MRSLVGFASCVDKQEKAAKGKAEAPECRAAARCQPGFTAWGGIPQRSPQLECCMQLVDAK